MTVSRQSALLLCSAISSLLLYLPCGHAHPQCLDFRPPFPTNIRLGFCTQYANYGCCGTRDDWSLRAEYFHIQLRMANSQWQQCKQFVKTLLCQSCSPYAAHIYDAEGSAKARTFPGLCQNYAEEVYDKCKSIVRFIDSKLASSDAFKTKTGFVQAASLSDTDYCYPYLLTNPALQFGQGSTLINSSSGCLCLEKVQYRRLANPVFARSPRDGTGRLFVGEQVGRIRIYYPHRRRWALGLFLDLRWVVAISAFPGDERGLLGMTFHPRFSENGRFFVSYATRRKLTDTIPPELASRSFRYNFKVRVSEMRVKKWNPNRADRRSEKVILELFQPFSNHNGGEIFFGVDGYLYALFGDGGGAGDVMEAAQNKSLLHGKAVRLDVDSNPSAPYTIPLDNPFVNESGSRPEIYAYGLRNPWRCHVDPGQRVTGEGRGRILCGDVGQSAFEEVDLLKKGGNYGWNSREGFACYRQDLCNNIGNEELPVTAYSHTVGKSVTGGVFYRGCHNPALDGLYIYGDYTSRRLFALNETDDGTWNNTELALCRDDLCQGHLENRINGRILSFGEDEFGEIYVLTSRTASSRLRNGEIHRILDPSTRIDPSSCDSDVSGFQRVLLPRAKEDQEDSDPKVKCKNRTSKSKKNKKRRAGRDQSKMLRLKRRRKCRKRKVPRKRNRKVRFKEQK